MFNPSFSIHLSFLLPLLLLGLSYCISQCLSIPLFFFFISFIPSLSLSLFIYIYIYIYISPSLSLSFSFFLSTSIIFFVVVFFQKGMTQFPHLEMPCANSSLLLNTDQVTSVSVHRCDVIIIMSGPVIPVGFGQARVAI